MQYKSTTQFHRHFRRFRKSEDGAITLLSLYIFLMTLAVGAIALDVAHLISARSQLQVAADVAGHTAIYYRDTHSPEDSKAKAVQMATAGLPVSFADSVIDVSDIKFGYWHEDTQVFEIDANSRAAVMVKTSRASATGNSIAGFLSHAIGKATWDVVTPAVFITYRPPCFEEGMVGDDIVDIQSGNLFVNGFCVHSNVHVSVSSNNDFENGTIVSMPRVGDLDLPASGFDTNTGLESALRSGSYVLGIIKLLKDGWIEERLREQVALTQWARTYITTTTVNPVTKGPAGKVTIDLLPPGYIHTVSCATGGNTLTFVPPTAPGGAPTPPFHDFILLTDCNISFGGGTVLEDVVILTTSTGSKSMQATAGLVVGKDDNCKDGGGTNLLTFGSMFFPAQLKVYGSQLIAAGNITFEAEATGLQGVAMVAGGTIDGSSGGVMGFCDGGMKNFEAEYFRMAE